MRIKLLLSKIYERLKTVLKRILNYKGTVVKTVWYWRTVK